MQITRKYPTFSYIFQRHYFLINHLIGTTPDTERIIILILHYLINHKPKNVFFYQVIPIWTTYQIRLQIALSSLYSKTKLKASSYSIPILAMFKLSMSTVPNEL